MQEVGDSHQKLGLSSQSKAQGISGEGSDFAHISSGKSKKRERSDHSSKAGKNDQPVEECSKPQKRECLEIYSDCGRALSNSASVQHLISKMKQDRSSSMQRITTADIIFETSKEDCLQQFMQLGGVSIMEEWIQEWSKSRASDSSMKSSDEGSDEEMLSILQALEKLPISLETLRGCTIGKSVKQLRNVKNSEIQRKARKLVDTWRKRVDLEINQESILPVVPSEHVQQTDATPRPSESSPAKHLEDVSPVAAISGSVHSHEAVVTMQAQNIISTLSSASTSDASPNEHIKVVEKDPNQKTTRLSVSSVTTASTLSPAKRQKHNLGLSNDRYFKDEVLSGVDSLKSKEKDPKHENNSNHTVNDTAIRKTNEYRKKLRSGGSTAIANNTESRGITSHNNGVQSMDVTNVKATCTGNNVWDSEQQHVNNSNRSHVLDHISVGNEAPDPPSAITRDTNNTCENMKELSSHDGKIDTVNESCLSSQSSCTERRNTSGSKAGTATRERTGSPLSPLQGDISLHKQVYNLQDGKEGAGQPSSKVSYHTDESYKFPATVEPDHLNGVAFNVNSCKDEVANVNCQGDQVALLDCEESSCSHNTHLSGQVGMVVATQHDETIEQSSAENTPSQVSLHGDPCVHNEAPCLEGRIVVATFCQASEKESSFVNLSHNVSDDASNKFSTPPSAANEKKFNNSASEIDKVHTRSGESPAITHSCHDFDLNEEFAMDEFLRSSCDPPSTNTCSMAMKATGTLSAPIAVSATSKGAFVPPVNALCKSDIGWTGSAATSAFRPAEPRHAPARSQQIQQHETKNINSFDLNVPDQDSIEEYPPLSGHGMQGAHLDLNHDGQEIQSRCSTICVSRNLKHLQTDGFKQHPEKRAVLDFDLNEQLEEVKQEEAMLCTESRTYGGPISFGGLSGQVTVGNDACWHATEDSFYPGPNFNGSRIELFSSSSANQLSVVSTRQVTPTTIFPSGLPIYSHTAPFLGGPISTPFPASFSYNPIPIGADTASMVAKSMSGTSVSSLGTRLRTDTSVRPSFVSTSVDDFRGGNNLYTWGRAPQNVYRNHGPTIISYSDAAASGREHAMNFDGSTSLEEHMRLFPQAAVPVSSLKRRDPDFFSGLKQTWH